MKMKEEKENKSKKETEKKQKCMWCSEMGGLVL